MRKPSSTSSNGSRWVISLSAMELQPSPRVWACVCTADGSVLSVWLGITWTRFNLPCRDITISRHNCGINQIPQNITKELRVLLGSTEPLLLWSQPGMPPVNTARDARPPYAFVLRASPWLGFRSAFFALKVHSWAWPPLVLRWSLRFILYLESVLGLVFPVSSLF